MNKKKTKGPYAMIRTKYAYRPPFHVFKFLQIKSELESYDTGGGFHVCDWFCWRHPISTGGQDTNSVFRVRMNSFMKTIC